MENFVSLPLAHFMPLAENTARNLDLISNEAEVRMTRVLRILVVDDEPSIGRALSLGLSSKELEVDVAENGGIGVRLGSRKQYDVLIADLCLPDIDGLEVIRRIKSYSPEIVPIVITGSYSRTTSIEATIQGVTAYLEKPLEMKSLKNAIRLGLERRQQREEETVAE